ncbi:hypothetical protein C2869_00750 [Saccharobesus litoralis]|uniref:EAL domain-containing protein n=2 Tax=Saccharobesus litoralis TaxID=2172099 RepID=A0A2S0VLH7_9ALTE|nr:hypothetical protein C2869_00750 [Saccharobesus litoralis]
MDDFGTGYSNLQRLINCDFDQIKLDRMFFINIESDQRKLVGLQAATTLVHGTGSNCLAEGIETEQHLQIALDNGVDFLQGYYLGRPQGFEQTLTLLRQFQKENKQKKLAER